LIYKANSKRDIQLLAKVIEDVPQQAQWYIVWYVWRNDLMRIRQWFPRLLLWFMYMRHGDWGTQMMFRQMEQKNPEQITQIISDTCRHVLYGQDKEEVGSLGGWSQREIDLFMECRWFKREKP
jgi:hypothetical protein